MEPENTGRSGPHSGLLGKEAFVTVVCQLSSWEGEDGRDNVLPRY